MAFETKLSTDLLTEEISQQKLQIIKNFCFKAKLEIHIYGEIAVTSLKEKVKHRMFAASESV